MIRTTLTGLVSAGEVHDQVEFRRVLAAPWPLMKGLRDALDVYVNGQSLCHRWKAAPFDVDEVRADLATKWIGGGRVPLLNCTCGNPGCGGYDAEVTSSREVVMWQLLWTDETYSMDRAALEDSLLHALTEA